MLFNFPTHAPDDLRMQDATYFWGCEHDFPVNGPLPTQPLTCPLLTDMSKHLLYTSGMLLSLLLFFFFFFLVVVLVVNMEEWFFKDDLGGQMFGSVLLVGTMTGPGAMKECKDDGQLELGDGESVFQWCFLMFFDPTPPKVKHEKLNTLWFASSKNLLFQNF